MHGAGGEHRALQSTLAWLQICARQPSPGWDREPKPRPCSVLWSLEMQVGSQG